MSVQEEFDQLLDSPFRVVPSSLSVYRGLVSLFPVLLAPRFDRPLYHTQDSDPERPEVPPLKGYVPRRPKVQSLL